MKYIAVSNNSGGRWRVPFIVGGGGLPSLGPVSWSVAAASGASGSCRTQGAGSGLFRVGFSFICLAMEGRCGEGDKSVGGWVQRPRFLGCLVGELVAVAQSRRPQEVAVHQQVSFSFPPCRGTLRANCRVPASHSGRFSSTNIYSPGSRERAQDLP
jgi:hypothetical protein